MKNFLEQKVSYYVKSIINYYDQIEVYVLEEFFVIKSDLLL